MLCLSPTPLIRLGNLFPDHDVYAKCEFLAPSGCFKIRGAVHLLQHLEREGNTRHLVVPSMGNTALFTFLEYSVSDSLKHFFIQFAIILGCFI